MCVTPRSRGYGDVTAIYIRRSKIPSHIHTKHQYKQKIEGESTVVIYISTIIVQVYCYHRTWSNITWTLHYQEAQSMNYNEIYRMNSTKSAHELQKKNREPRKGPGRKGLWTDCWWSMLPLCISDQQPEEFTSSKLWNMDMQDQGCQKQSNEWWDDRQVACKDRYTCIAKSESKACIENRVVSIHTWTWIRHYVMRYTNAIKPVVQAQ